MPKQFNYKGTVTLRKREEYSNQNISLILLHIKMLQQVEEGSPENIQLA
jgi:hypothetical protein